MKSPITLTLMLLLLIASCTHDDQRSSTPTPFLARRNSDCANLRCWEGIYPGATTFDEAILLLTIRYGLGAVSGSQRYIEWDAGNLDDGYWGGSVWTNPQGIALSVDVNFEAEQRL